MKDIINRYYKGLNTQDEETFKVYVWPDGTYRYSSEYSDFGDAWKGDDYLTMYFSVDTDEDEIEECIAEYFGGK